MDPSELTLATTQELIAELMRRQTFLGVVVQYDRPYKGEPWGEERMFKVHFNHNLARPTAARLLDSVAQYIDL